MTIGLAQTKPIKGAIAQNKQQHLQLIELAAQNGAQLIVFPELSLTGYEPTLATALAFTEAENTLLAGFQEMSDQHQITIGIGVPLQKEDGVAIGALFFRPQQSRCSYTKAYLHVDEEPYFVSASNSASIPFEGARVGFAICYELSIAEHTERAMEGEAAFYLASVAKTAKGVAQAHQQLAATARQYQVPVLMVNSVGPSDNFVAAGQTAVWNKEGRLLGQLGEKEAGVLIFREETEEVECLLL